MTKLREKLQISHSDVIRVQSYLYKCITLFVREKQLCHPVMLAWFSIQILVNFEFFKTFAKYFLEHYGAQMSF